MNSVIANVKKAGELQTVTPKEYVRQFEQRKGSRVRQRKTSIPPKTFRACARALVERVAAESEGMSIQGDAVQLLLAVSEDFLTRDYFPLLCDFKRNFGDRSELTSADFKMARKVLDRAAKPSDESYWEEWMEHF